MIRIPSLGNFLQGTNKIDVSKESEKWANDVHFLFAKEFNYTYEDVCSTPIPHIFMLVDRFRKFKEEEARRAKKNSKR